MTIEWAGIAFVLVILLLSMVIIKVVDKKVKLHPEIKRKSFHITMGLVMLTFPYIFTSPVSAFAVGIIALITLFVIKNTKLKSSIGEVLYGVDRESLGEVFFAISVVLIFYLSKGNKILYSIPILILTFADSTAALIGKNYAKKNLAEMNEDAKSIEGSFMFFIVAFMSTLVPLLLFTQVGREETLIISTIVGFNVALIELISHTGNDNLLIPLTTFAFIATHINLDVVILRHKLIIIGIIVLLVRVVNRVKQWSKLALAEILVAGYLTVTLYGFYALIPPLLLLLTVMRLPKLKENEKGCLYDARIIETNIIIGIAICGIVAITSWRKEFFMIYATCYAMHLTVNTFVRFKYYLNYSEIDSILFAISKGIGLVFIPSLIVQKLYFKEIVNVVMLIAMAIAIILSGVMIYFRKKNVKEEEISIDNGYMHMKIVLIFTSIICGLQVLI